VLAACARLTLPFDWLAFAVNFAIDIRFFLYERIGAFQGDLNPLSTRSIIETCTLPVLLSGCENWILSNKCHEDLESFIGELAKRTLKWPKHFSNTEALVTLDLHSAKSYLLQRKLIFLRRQLTSDSFDSNRIGVVAMKSLSDDPESLCLVKEYREPFNYITLYGIVFC